VGSHWGWGWGKMRGDAFTTASHFATTLASSGLNFDNNHLSGPIFGGQLGCNYQWPGSQFVIGVEGSYAGADIQGQRSRTAAFFFPTGTTDVFTGSVHTKIDSIGSITGRIGWAGTGIFGNNNALFYFKGGWAWAHQRTNVNFTAASNEPFANGFQTLPFAAEFSGSRSGWTIGGGVEWALSFAPGASIFWEYDYYDFGNRHTLNTPFFTDTAIDVGLHPKVSTVKIGVNYRLFGQY
jgi:outer membrane immunogenic protein